MRLTPTRVCSALCLSIIGLLMWIILGQIQSPQFTQTCHHPEQFQDDLHKLANNVHQVLSDLRLVHFLCYGSLWGQLRLSRSLPWDADVEFCVFNEELSKLDEVYFVRTFRKSKLILSYNSAEGYYLVHDPEFEGASVQLIVFEEDHMIHMFKRVGWKRRILPPDCENMKSLDCFPPRLLRPPLPLKEFGGFVLPVPREGIELQKYHYQDNWWKEVLPKNC